ncbi:DUF695 domain-containing protein [Luteipulveratus flavus]|uniref:DUF695 domain-containing protein n=1 Tax=Luteipulveratus flavus TaxID=3031728 RepID=A0ABT6C5X6_9MICO|nr:DUF695 domain-containing protein [Luteipulveratus sp. YIM 133296]MDF8263712.1 DUF695 domain-containing protein [Luteipulveratus sp. YIM 133296]
MVSGGRAQQSAGDSRVAAIDAFWRWWLDEGADRCSSALGGPEADTLVALLDPHVQAIDPGLAWELAPGSDSVHLLVVSAAGDPDLRAPARRWRRVSPEPDAIWSYSDVRPAAPDLAATVLDIEDHSIDLASVQVAVRRRGTVVDVTVHHPAMPELGEHRTLAAFLILDAALGEEQTETWIGELATSDVPTIDGFGLHGLVAVVRDLRDDHLGADGRPSWVHLQGDGPDGPVLAAAQVPLAAASAPELDTYVALTVPYDAGADGLPTPESLAALEGLESALRESAGDNGRLVAHESAQGVRRLHLYVDGTSTGAEDLRAAALRQARGTAEVEVEHDPGWSAVQHLRG